MVESPMKIKLLHLIVFLIMCTASAAQELKQTAYYMQLPNVSQTAKDFHGGKVQLNDSIAYAIFDSMYTENDDTRPFYMYLVSKMLLNHSSRLPSNMSFICTHYIQNNSDALMSLLFCKGVKPDYRYAWAGIVAKDIRKGCDGDLLPCFKTSRTLALERCSDENKQRLEAIYVFIRADLQLNNRH